MSAVVSIKKTNKTSTSHLQKTFDRLKKKIGILQNQIKEKESNLEQGLHFFNTEVTPMKNSLRKLSSETITSLYEYYKSSKKLSKTKKRELSDLIVSKCYEMIERSSTIEEVSPEVQVILKELNGVDCLKLFNSNLDESKAKLSQLFEDLNINIDLSKIDASDDDASTMRKIMEAMFEAKEGQEAEPTKPKSKKKLLKEIQAKELDQLQNKGLGTIYKNLAKTLHPDLELDPIIKAEKEEIMKRLTVAYDNGDLHTLLSIEMEWLNRSESNEKERKLQSNEQLAILNSILKEQIEEYEHLLGSLSFHPRYMFLSFLKSQNEKLMISQLRSMHNELKNECDMLQDVLKELTSPTREKFLDNLFL